MSSISWDAGTAISASGVVTPTAAAARIDLTTIPAWASNRGGDPIRYYALGVMGWIAGPAYLPPVTVQWPQQALFDPPKDASGVYYRLATGVSGTLYQGVEMTDALPIASYVYRSAVQSISNDTITPITFDQQYSDRWDMWQAGTNPTRVTIREPGWYLISGRVIFAANATGVRQAGIARNGVNFAWQSLGATAFAANNPAVEVVTAAPLDAGDYLELLAYQTSGGSLNLATSVPYSPSLSVVRIG